MTANRSDLPRLSVVLPTFNAAEWLPDTLDRLRAALRAADWENSEIIVVDDGSTDETAALLSQDAGTPRLTVITQNNLGRFQAREAGLKVAQGEYVLFIDSRVHAGAQSLKFLADQLRSHPERRVWNGHVEIPKGGSLYASFWEAITFLAWRRYLAHPKLMSYSDDDYDFYPKGTTFFVAPRDWLLDAVQGFASSYSDLRNANDDTLMIRPLAKRARIYLSPEFSCVYFPRDSGLQFLRHSVHRGTVFVDGYFHRGSRFFWPLLAFVTLSPACLIALLRRPKRSVLVALAGCLGLTFGAAAAGAPKRASVSLGVLAPAFGASYGFGIVRGMTLRLLGRRPNL